MEINKNAKLSILSSATIGLQWPRLHFLCRYRLARGNCTRTPQVAGPKLRPPCDVQLGPADRAKPPLLLLQAPNGTTCTGCGSSVVADRGGRSHGAFLVQTHKMPHSLYAVFAATARNHWASRIWNSSALSRQVRLSPENATKWRCRSLSPTPTPGSASLTSTVAP